MILQLIGLILGFLFSPLGLFVWLLGLLTFISLPILGNLTGWKRLANVHLWLAMWAVQRASIVLSEHNDVLFKSMRYVDLGVERISFSDDSKDFEDPAAALHHWMGFPFALGLERDGILFDPRHAAIAMCKREYDERDLGAIRGSDEDWSANGVDEWLPGVFEIPDAFQLVDLSAVHHIIDGGERAEYPDRIERIYELSRDPFTSSREALRLLIPVAAYFGTVIMLWQISSQGGGGGGTTISFGSVLLLLLAAPLPKLRDRLAESDVDWWHLAKTVLGVTLVGGLILGLVAVTNVVYALVVLFTFTMGFTVLPFLTLLLRPTRLAGGFSRYLYLKLGLLGYSKPVFVWKPKKYELREYADLETGADVNWYSLVGSTVGFSFKPDESSFGPDVVDTDTIANHTEAVTDGGERDTRFPPGYRKAADLLPTVYGGYVPKPSKLDDSNIYLNSGIALGRMTNAATGEKSLRRLLQSKEKYGGGTFDVSDRTLLWASMGAILLGVLTWVVVPI